MSQSPFVVTFSGDPLAGKSSAISALMEHYKKEGFTIGENDNGKCIIKIAAGQMFRRVAEHAGIPLNELNAFAKKSGNTMRALKEMSSEPSFFKNLSDDILDRSVDAFVDEYVMNYVEELKTKYAGKDDVVIFVDSRIAGLLMKRLNIENLCIRLEIQPEIAAERLIKDAQNRKEEVSSLSKNYGGDVYSGALDSVVDRASKERERFIIKYSGDLNNQTENGKVDIQNLGNYDLVINAAGSSLANETVVLFQCIERARAGKKINKFWRSTKYIYPGKVDTIEEEDLKSIHVIKVDDQYYAVRGQEYVGVANRIGYLGEKEGNEDSYPLVPIELVAIDKQFIFYTGKDGEITGCPADLYIKKNITQEVVKNFEIKNKFEYPEKGVTRIETLKNRRCLEK